MTTPAAKGDDGPMGSSAPQVHDRGADKPPVSPELRIGDIEEVAAHIPITALAMSLYRWELDMLNNQSAEIAEKISWISACAASPRSGAAFYENRTRRLNTTEVGEPSKPELEALSRQATIMVSNVALGLDVYGHAPQFVSDLTPDFLKSQSVEWIEIATEVEQAYLSLLDKNSSLEVKTAKLKAARAQVSTSIRIADETIRRNGQTIAALQKDISLLIARVVELQLLIEMADQDFKRDVAANGGCELEDMINFAVGVVTVAAAIYTGVGALTGAMAAANAAAAATAWQGVQGVIDDIKILKKSFDESGFVDAYRDMKRGYNEAKEALKTDRTKLLVSLEAFESQLAPYLDMPSARKYRDLMRQLVDVAQTKNAKQLDLTQLLHQNDAERTLQVSRQLEADRIGRMVASSNNPAMTECIVFLGRFLEQAKRSILRITDLQRRGMVYLTCAPINLTYRTSRVAELSAVQLQLGQAWIRGLEEQGGSRQEMTSTFELSRLRYPDVFRALEKENRSAFAIPVDHPEFNRGGTSYLLCSSVDMLIDGLPGETQAFTCRLTHSGSSVIRNRAGQGFTFIHSRRPTNLSYERTAAASWKPTIKIDGNLRGESEFIALSPFTTWLLEFPPGNQIDWNRVDALRLIFTVSFIPSDEVYRPEAVLRELDRL
ncbi:MAG: hypothetical protein ACK43M_20365 [Allorhizobium sp.]